MNGRTRNGEGRNAGRRTALNKPGEEGSRAWFYTESKEQKSQVQSQDVQARSSYVPAEAADLEGIAIRHRQFVKDYFMTLHEGVR